MQMKHVQEKLISMKINQKNRKVVAQSKKFHQRQKKKIPTLSIQIKRKKKKRERWEDVYVPAQMAVRAMKVPNNPAIISPFTQEKRK